MATTNDLQTDVQLFITADVNYDTALAASIAADAAAATADAAAVTAKAAKDAAKAKVIADLESLDPTTPPTS